MSRALSAPGKLFLAGEYAVLWGGVGHVLACGGRVGAAVRRRTDRRIDLLLADGRLSGLATPAGVRWEAEIEEPFRFVARAVDLAYRALGVERNGFALALESSPTHDGQKLGFGSSARATVLAAEAARWALDLVGDAFKLALLAHSSAQGGRGSGADVAASFAGGLVRYRRYPLERLQAASNAGRLGPALADAPPVDCARTDAPRLPLLYAYSGASASTPALIREVELRVGDDARRAFVERSDALGGQLERGLGRGAFGDVREAMTGLQALLGTLGVPLEAGLARVLSVAEVLGCAGKQSGAGGGDGAVLAAPDEAAAAALEQALRERGHLVVRLSPEVGLRGEGTCPAQLTAWLDTAEG